MSRLPDACGARRVSWRRAGLVVVGVLAFLATAAALRSIQRPLYEANLRPQLEAFLETKDDYDAVYIGSSRVQRGVRPDVIDARLSSPGREFRSFNLGVAGMQSFEADWLLRQVLAAEPARLRFVVIEMPWWRPQLTQRDGLTERFVEWHDLHATRLVVGSIWKAPLSLWGKLSLSWRHLGQFATRAANYATGARFAASPGATWDRLIDGLVATQGYLPLDVRLGGAIARRRQEFLADPAIFHRNVAKIRSRAERGALSDLEFLPHYNRYALQTQVEAMRQAGIDPVYLVSPLLSGAPAFELLKDDGSIPNLIDLRNPLVYPELFAMENRFDRSHMSDVGAALLSERIAEQLEPLAGPRNGT